MDEEGDKLRFKTSQEILERKGEKEGTKKGGREGRKTGRSFCLTLE